MRRTQRTTGGSVVESLLQKREGSAARGYFCTPSTQSLLAEMLCMKGICSVTLVSWCCAGHYRVTRAENACLKLAWQCFPSPPASSCCSPCTHTPLLWGNAPEGARGRGRSHNLKLLQITERCCSCVLQAQSTSRTTAEAARSSPPSHHLQALKVLRHFVFLFQNLFPLVCKDGEVLF